MNPRKVLYISPNAHLGGAEKVCGYFLKYHDRTRYVPSIAFLRDGPLVNQFKNFGMPVFLLSEIRLRQIHKHSRLIGELAEIIKEQNIEVVHSTMVYGQIFGG